VIGKNDLLKLNSQQSVSEDQVKEMQDKIHAFEKD